MKKPNRPLDPSEIRVAIQAKIEDLSVRQLLDRDKLVREAGFTLEDATKVVRREDYNGL